MKISTRSKKVCFVRNALFYVFLSMLLHVSFYFNEESFKENTFGINIYSFCAVFDLGRDV